MTLSRRTFLPLLAAGAALPAGRYPIRTGHTRFLAPGNATSRRGPTQDLLSLLAAHSSSIPRN